MKTSRFIALAAVCTLTAFSSSRVIAVDQPPTPVDQSRPGAVAVDPVATAAAAPGASWDDIKTMTFEQRAEFVAGVHNLEAKLDGQIAELNAKRAKLKNDPKEWDFAMKAFNDARSYVKSLAAEADDSTADLWNSYKDKMERAFLSAQEAYDKVKTTTTQ